jgi:hypothetical protein
MTIRLAVPAEPATHPKEINPPFGDLLLRAIDNALRAAWALLVNDVMEHDTLYNGCEPKITMHLRKKLNHVRIHGGAKGYNATTFERPQIASEYYDYKDQTIRKPDIVFALNGAPRPGVWDDDYDAIFVECKLITQKSSQNTGRYCNQGLVRFVEGAYGWRMPHGMMVAYVRTEQKLPSALSATFAKASTAAKLNLRGPLTVCKLSATQPRVYVSSHDRTWQLRENVAPGPIEVRHLWLNVCGK